MKRLVVMIAPFNTRSGYGDHARSLFYSIMDREDLEIKCLDVKWGNTPRNHLRPEVPRHKKLLDSFVSQDQIQGQPDILIDIRIPNEFASGAKVNIGVTAGVETDVVSPAFLEGMNRMNFNIVPSNFTAETFGRCVYDKMEDLPNGQKQKIGTFRNEKPIKVLFEGVDTDKYYPKDKYQTKKEDPILYDELNDLIKNNENNEKKLKLFLLPKDEADKKNAIIEIRAGTGGLEASLFAGDLFKMYEKLSNKKNGL